MIKLRRISDQPILFLKKEHPWEATAVFNCAAIYDNGLVHMIYRATDIAPNGKEGPYINRLGYAVSKDGIHFNSLEQPILSNDVEQEARGPEDPRIVKMGDPFGSAWNDFTYPLIVINTDNMKVLALGIAGFKGFREGLTQWPLMMAASAMAILPMIIIFVLAQKYFIEGVKTTGLKG